MSKDGVFSGPYFPVFGLNTEIYKSPYSVRIQENKDQKKLRFGHFSRSDPFMSKMIIPKKIPLSLR